MKLPEYITDLISAYEKAGYTALAVGGCVRDCLLGIEPGDYDLAVNAPPEVTKELFGNGRVLETGLKHGTVTVLCGERRVEVTVFRKEGGYSDNRHPDSVVFAQTFREDASRRDFTVNAMGLSSDGELYDYYGGRADLESRLIRAVGDPEERFREDALRIMRALRFASVLDFNVEENTRRAINNCKALLLNIAPERLLSELVKLVCGKAAERIIIDFIDVLGIFCPCLLPMKNFAQNNPYHIYDVLTHTAKAVGEVRADPLLRLAMLFHDTGKPLCYTQDERGGHFYGHAKLSAELAEKTLTDLKASSALREGVTEAVRIHDIPIEASEKFVRRQLGRIGEEGFRRLIEMQRADNKAQSPAVAYRQNTFDEALAVAGRLSEEGKCFTLKKLAVNGNDLITAGIPQGKETGRLLKELLDAVIDGRLENEKKVLLAEAALIHHKNT